MAESMVERANHQSYRRSGAGKGDAPRPINKSEYDRNWERIFKRKKK